MELYFSLAIMVAAALTALTVLRAAEFVWFRPRRMERLLRGQGLRGSSYRFPLGDLSAAAKLIREARKNPMPLSHRIVPRVVPQLHDAIKLHGENTKMLLSWFGPFPQVLVMDPKIINEIFSSKHHFEKPKLNPFSRFVISGVGIYEGEKWAKHRRIINPAFHVQKIKRMVPAISACCDELIYRWEELFSKGSVKGVCELDVWPELQILTGDVISRAAFGSSYNEGRRIFELQREQVDLLVQARQSLYIPGQRFLPTKKNRRRNEIHREVVSLLRSMIEQRKESVRKGNSNSDDLLGLLMEPSLQYSDLTTEEIIDECKVFYFAGHETTAILLTWTMIALSMHPTWQARARDEVLQAFGQDSPNFDELNRLRIVNMILCEVLRLYPPGVILYRQTREETKVGEFRLPAGVQLALPIILLHRSRLFWGDDAEDFNPERFAEGITSATKNQVIYFPFGWGHRICIGQNFALCKVKMALARILQRFSFQLSPSYSHEPSLLLTLQPQYGAPLILKKL